QKKMHLYLFSHIALSSGAWGFMLADGSTDMPPLAGLGVSCGPSATDIGLLGAISAPLGA
ncbi:MAG: hypothetical protein WD577_13315, partial [Bacteroidales bacterium]